MSHFILGKDEAGNCKCSSKCQSWTSSPRATLPRRGATAPFSSKISEEQRLSVLPGHSGTRPLSGGAENLHFSGIYFSSALGRAHRKVKATSVLLITQPRHIPVRMCPLDVTGSLQRPGDSSPPFQVSSQRRTTVSQGLFLTLGEKTSKSRDGVFASFSLSACMTEGGQML